MKQKIMLIRILVATGLLVLLHILPVTGWDGLSSIWFHTL